MATKSPALKFEPRTVETSEESAAAFAELDVAFNDAMEPLRAKLTKIDTRIAKFMADIVDEKRAVRDEIIALEREHAEHAARLRDPAAGPDQGVGVG
jgi:hypothetical protein